MGQNDERRLTEVLDTDVDGKAYSHRTSSKPRRNKKEGHDELIAKLTPPGTTAQLFMLSGVTYVGELAGSDRFTISLRECVILDGDGEEAIGEKLTDSRRKVQLIYKHGIESMNFDVHGDKNKTHGPDLDE